MAEKPSSKFIRPGAVLLSRLRTRFNAKTNTHIRYSPWFRTFMRDNPNMIKNFLAAREELFRGKPIIAMGSCVVERLRRAGNAHSFLYAVQAGNKVFFVKETNHHHLGELFVPELDLAHHQIDVLDQAHELVSQSLRFQSHFEITRYHFAWANGLDSFLVTDYYPGDTLSRGTAGIPTTIKEMIPGFERFLRDHGFLDLHRDNLLWSPERKKVVVLDLRKK